VYTMPLHRVCGGRGLLSKVGSTVVGTRNFREAQVHDGNVKFIPFE
jgi:hypothetical protein